MSEERSHPEPARGLRLVSDEGRTVADPPSIERESQDGPIGPIGATSDTSSARPDHTSAHPSARSSAPTEGHVDVAGIDERRSLDDDVLYAAIEAVLMVATEPVSADLLAAVVGVPVASVCTVCNELAREYARAERGFTLMNVAGGYQVQTAASVAEFVERFVGSRRSARLSAAAMETLAVVAYKQPISRAQISAIRGVNADGVVRTLADQGYVAEVGRDPGPGNVALLGTTPTFLERLNLDSLDDLPSLAELQVDGDAVEALDRLAAGR